MKKRTAAFQRLCLACLLAAPLPLAAQGLTGPRITGASAASGQFSLSWAQPPTNWQYTVQSRDSLTAGLWINVRGTEPWPIDLLTWTDPRPPAAALRFYRVIGVPPTVRGELQADTALTTYTKAALILLQQFGVTPQYGVKVYKLDYATVDALGAPILASGALAVPEGATNALPLMSYQHGTVLKKSDAPSANIGFFSESVILIAYAATGYAAVAPDYLGLGDSPGLHPYHHAQTEATAGVDMLRAARAFCASQQLALNGQLFLCGYSQGGHATAALQRELEAYHTNEFTVTASAPMSGAYDLSGVTANDFLSGRAMPNPYYFPYLLAAYQAVYHLTNSLSDLLASPWNTNLPPLFDGQHDSSALNALVPAVVTNILKPAVLAAFLQDTNHPLRLALRDNDLYQWTPHAPVRLYYCSGDQDVDPANSQEANASFLSRGANVLLVNTVPGANHTDCSIPSLLAAKQWFDSLRH